MEKGKERNGKEGKVRKGGENEERWKKKTKIFDLLFEIVPNQFVFTRALLILPPSTTAISLCTCQVELVVVGLNALTIDARRDEAHRQSPENKTFTIL